jgi:tetratricopeptide (TPR) repeat protein
VENFGQVLLNIGEDGQQKLRAFLQNTNQFNLLATTPSLVSAISRQSSPFYGFFQLTHLQPLSLPDAVLLVEKLALAANDEKTAAFVRTPAGRARIRAVQHLAGGNHRIFVLFYEFLRQAGSDSVLEPLLRTLDQLTPYYQSQMSLLSQQQQKIVGFLCQQRLPANVKGIAAGCFITQQTAASQLKLLLMNKYVRVSRSGRESYYELAEPLLRICIEAKTHRELPLRLLVEFLRFWFSRDELEQRLSAVPEADPESHYLSAALREYESQAGHEHLDPEIEELCRSIDAPNRTADRVREDAEELSELSKRAEDWGHFARAMIRLGRTVQALEFVEQKLKFPAPTFSLLYASGRLLHENREFSRAVEMFEAAENINSDDAYFYLLWADTLVRLREFEKAEQKISRALALDQDFFEVDASLLRARIAIAQKKYSRAIAILEPNRKKDPFNVAVLNWTAVAMAEARRFEEAFKLFGEAEEIEPSAEYVKANMAKAKSASGDYFGALSKIEELTRIAPVLNDNAQHTRCIALLATGQYRRAVESTPADILSHCVMHKLIDLLNAKLDRTHLRTDLESLLFADDGPTWRDAFKGALIEFLRAARGWSQVTSELRKWYENCEAILGGLPDYALILRIFAALLELKSGNYRALLSLSLEERRLLVSEAEEIDLLAGKQIALPMRPAPTS